jgi:hypothetical protein
MAPAQAGLYVAQPKSLGLVPVTRDPRYVENCARVNCTNVKVGKARNLALREKNYHKDFGPENIVFIPLLLTDDIQGAETAVLRELHRYRKRSPKGGLMDWLEGISLEETTAAIFASLKRQGIEYSRI